MLTLYEFNHQKDHFSWVGGSLWVAQSFEPQISHQITLVKLWLFKPVGWDPKDGTLNIYAADVNGKPTGVPLATGIIHAADLEITVINPVEVSLGSGTPLTAGQSYVLVIVFPDTIPSQDYPLMVRYWYSVNSAQVIGKMMISEDSGATWTIYDALDWTFEEWGEPVPQKLQRLGDIHIDQLIYQHAERMEV